MFAFVRWFILAVLRQFLSSIDLPILVAPGCGLSLGCIGAGTVDWFEGWRLWSGLEWRLWALRGTEHSTSGTGQPRTVEEGTADGLMGITAGVMSW